MRFASLLAVTLLIGALVTPGTATAQTETSPTPSDVMYLTATGPFREQLGAYQEHLATLVRAATGGQLDEIATSELGDLTRELFTARRVFVDAVPSARLDQYDRTVELALDRAYSAAVLLLRAQVTESLPDRTALIREAGMQSGSSSRLLKDAADELQAVLPGTV